MIVLDPRGFLNRLMADLILDPRIDGRFYRARQEAEEMQLNATEKSERPAQTDILNIRSRRSLTPFIAVLAGALAGCGDTAPPPAAVGPPSVTVAQPTKRTVTDWDEFTGRFEAV